jgi:DNA-binding NarL/FixJ family response regulator
MSASVNEWSKVLSPRERAVALLIAGGLSNKDIARELGLSPGTVKSHVHNIFVKLGEKSRHRLIVQHDTRAHTAGPAVVGDVKSRLA